VRARLEEIRRQALEELSKAENTSQLENMRNKFLGRKGILTQEIRRLRTASPEEKPVIGKVANELKALLSSEFARKLEELKRARPVEGKKPFFDVTLPGKKRTLGKLHPITQTIQRIEEIFRELGFKCVFGPEIETEYYNFDALSMTENHPARDEQDSFYVDEGILLRTQTSPVQIRVMEKEKPPIRIIATGKCFRRDATDASHTSMFHQVEGLLVDKRVTFGDLKGVLEVFVKRMFGSDVRMRFRPDFFPFTEPSADAAISCIMCGGEGCSSCSGSGWIEILGAGMVDPEVFRKVNYDPEKYTGFAFGMGIERIAMLKYGINDIRLFLENDMRFLSQF
jgi:phenylalanyl-tRNA synthetase alpha chain